MHGKVEDLKKKFIDNLKNAGGIIYVACENTGISRPTYYKWCNTDDEFKQHVEEVMDAQIDHVESRLMKLINAGDTTATIFYLKSKGKGRGWSDRPPQVVQPTAPIPVPAIATPDPTVTVETPRLDGVAIEKKIRNKKSYIVRLLKKQGKYTAELSMQVDIVAQLLVKTDILAEEIFDASHDAVNVEISREGNTRESVSPKERLYLDYLGQTQKALRALGMNTDARERKTDNDGFSEFMNAFKSDDE